MATARLKKVDEYLTCTVCTEEYSDPCTLKCQHTFCRKCITLYTKTKPEALRSKTIPCPCCHQLMRVPDPTRPVDEWAYQVKPSIIILGLIDTSEPEESTSESDRRCGACEYIGKATSAEFWCPDCEVALCDRCTEAHRGHPASRDHEICDLSEDVKVKRQRKVMCTEHKKNQIEFHCNDCRKSACQKCCILHHRSCSSLVTIESMKLEVKSVLERKRQTLMKQLKIRPNKVTIKKFSVSKAHISKTKIQSKIRSTSQTAIDKIKQKEKQLMAKLDEVIEKQISHLQTDVKIEEIEIQMYRQHYEFIDQILKTESFMDMYDMYQACLSEAVVFKKGRNGDTTETRDIEDIIFTQDSEILQQTLENLQLGEINVTYKKPSPYQEMNEPMSSPVLSNTFDTRTENDERDPNIVDMTVLVLNGVHVSVLTDYSNHCVKSFFLRNKKTYYSRLQLNNGPWGITQLNERQVMVAVPDCSQIIKIEVSPELHLILTMKTDKKYCRLTALNNKSMAALTWHRGDCIHIISMTGQVIKSISNVKMFTDPWLISCNNKGNLVMTLYRKGSLTCLTQEGNVLWTYTDKKLTGLVGITTTSTGSILVSDYKSNKVIQLSDGGKFIQEVLTSKNGIKEPLAIFYDEEGYLFCCDGYHLKKFQLT